MSVNGRSRLWPSSRQATAARRAGNQEQSLFLTDLADLYIAGPMTGLPDLNYPAFYEAENYLIACGYTVENPAWNTLPEGFDPDNYIGYLRLGFNQLVRCKAIYLLEGWEKSKGASWEFDLAIKLKMGVYFEGEFGPHSPLVFKSRPGKDNGIRGVESQSPASQNGSTE